MSHADDTTGTRNQLVTEWVSHAGCVLTSTEFAACGFPLRRTFMDDEMSEGLQAVMPGKIILSCGCELTDDMGDMEGLYVRFRDEVCDAVDGFSNAVAYACYCPRCQDAIRDILIHSDEEERAWLDAPPPHPMNVQGGYDGK